jgi:hypothetical protein
MRSRRDQQGRRLKVGNDVCHIKIVSYDHKALAADAATAANKLVFRTR